MYEKEAALVFGHIPSPWYDGNYRVEANKMDNFLTFVESTKNRTVGDKMWFSIIGLP